MSVESCNAITDHLDLHNPGEIINFYISEGYVGAVTHVKADSAVVFCEDPELHYIQEIVCSLKTTDTTKIRRMSVPRIELDRWLEFIQEFDPDILDLLDCLVKKPVWITGYFDSMYEN